MEVSTCGNVNRPHLTFESTGGVDQHARTKAPLLIRHFVVQTDKNELECPLVKACACAILRRTSGGAVTLYESDGPLNAPNQSSLITA